MKSWYVHYTYQVDGDFRNSEFMMILYVVKRIIDTKHPRGIIGLTNVT